jgi:hypothetical protein
MIEATKAAHDYTVEITEPPVGDLPILHDKIVVAVLAKGKTKVLEVRAQAYQGQAPAVPEFKLHPGQGPDVFTGKIPAFLGKFRIKVRARFLGDPEIMEYDDEGPYTGIPVAGAPGTYQVDILDPDPGLVTLGMGAEFNVKVLAAGDTTVNEVKAQAYQGSEPIEPSMEAVSLLRTPGTNEYTGTITGFISAFRIKAWGSFAAAPTIDDDDGDYTGSVQGGP